MSWPASSTRPRSIRSHSEPPPRTRSGTAPRPSPAHSRPSIRPGTNWIRSTAQRPSPRTSTAPQIRCGDGRAAAANTSDQVLVESAELTPDGDYVADVRVRVALISQRAAGGQPRPIVTVGRGTATVHDAAAATEEIAIPLPGWSARSDRRTGTWALSGERSLGPSADPSRGARRLPPHPDLARLARRGRQDRSGAGQCGPGLGSNSGASPAGSTCTWSGRWQGDGTAAETWTGTLRVAEWPAGGERRPPSCRAAFRPGPHGSGVMPRVNDLRSVDHFQGEVAPGTAVAQGRAHRNFEAAHLLR